MSDLILQPQHIKPATLAPSLMPKQSFKYDIHIDQAKINRLKKSDRIRIEKEKNSYIKTLRNEIEQSILSYKYDDCANAYEIQSNIEEMKRLGESAYVKSLKIDFPKEWKRFQQDLHKSLEVEVVKKDVTLINDIVLAQWKGSGLSFPDFCYLKDNPQDMYLMSQAIKEYSAWEEKKKSLVATDVHFNINDRRTYNAMLNEVLYLNCMFTNANIGRRDCDSKNAYIRDPIFFQSTKTDKILKNGKMITGVTARKYIMDGVAHGFIDQVGFIDKPGWLANLFSINKEKFREFKKQLPEQLMMDVGAIEKNFFIEKRKQVQAKRVFDDDGDILSEKDVNELLVSLPRETVNRINPVPRAWKTGLNTKVFTKEAAKALFLRDQRNKPFIDAVSELSSEFNRYIKNSSIDEDKKSNFYVKCAVKVAERKITKDDSEWTFSARAYTYLCSCMNESSRRKHEIEKQEFVKINGFDKIMTRPFLRDVLREASKNPSYEILSFDRDSNSKFNSFDINGSIPTITAMVNYRIPLVSKYMDHEYDDIYDLLSVTPFNSEEDRDDIKQVTLRGMFTRNSRTLKNSVEFSTFTPLKKPLSVRVQAMTGIELCHYLTLQRKLLKIITGGSLNREEFFDESIFMLSCANYLMRNYGYTISLVYDNLHEISGRMIEKQHLEKAIKFAENKLFEITDQCGFEKVKKPSSLDFMSLKNFVNGDLIDSISVKDHLGYIEVVLKDLGLMRGQVTFDKQHLSLVSSRAKKIIINHSSEILNGTLPLRDRAYLYNLIVQIKYMLLHKEIDCEH